MNVRSQSNEGSARRARARITALKMRAAGQRFPEIAKFLNVSVPQARAMGVYAERTRNPNPLQNSGDGELYRDIQRRLEILRNLQVITHLIYQQALRNSSGQRKKQRARSMEVTPKISSENERDAATNNVIYA